MPALVPLDAVEPGFEIQINNDDTFCVHFIRESALRSPVPSQVVAAGEVRRLPALEELWDPDGEVRKAVDH